MTKKEMLSDIAANDYSRLRNVHSDFLLLDSRANNARRQFNMGLIEFKQQEDYFSQCRYAALDLVEKMYQVGGTIKSSMNEGTLKSDDWTKTSDILPPVSTKVECAVQLPGLICKAWLFDITRNDGEAYARFLVDDPDKIIFICPKYWRFIK